MAPGGGAGRAIRVLNVAEKPSVAKTVSGILSRNQGLRMREGRSRYNKVFEFNYTIQGQPCQLLFPSVTGHLMEIEFEDRYRKWHSCDPVDLFQAPIRKHVPEFTPTSLTLDSGITRPPPLLSEAVLLDCMDKAGIGTDATMHDHIEKLTDRFYATKESSCFTPTNLGEALVMGYDDMGCPCQQFNPNRALQRSMDPSNRSFTENTNLLPNSLTNGGHGTTSQVVLVAVMIF